MKNGLLVDVEDLGTLTKAGTLGRTFPAASGIGIKEVLRLLGRRRAKKEERMKVTA